MRNVNQQKYIISKKGYDLKGKNFSCNNIGQRKKSDFYETPYCLTQELLNRVKLSAPILEPACGDKAIVKVLFENDYSEDEIDYYDIKDGQDFLLEKRKYRTIITNPPYSLAFQFIQKAKQLCNDFYFLLPLSYLHGKQRLDYIYSDKTFPLNCIYVFDRYPMLGDPLRKDMKIRTGMVVFAWYHFSKKPEYSEPIIRWIDIQKYILSKKDLI
jgi:hypothetical protein